jgi:hypothetical protein
MYACAHDCAHACMPYTCARAHTHTHTTHTHTHVHTHTQHTHTHTHIMGRTTISEVRSVSLVLTFASSELPCRQNDCENNAKRNCRHHSLRSNHPCHRACLTTCSPTPSAHSDQQQLAPQHALRTQRHGSQSMTSAITSQCAPRGDGTRTQVHPYKKCQTLLCII